MPGFQQYGDLPEYYGTAGAFVHVSTLEPWGLVINEAMASGLPVLVSDRCGCTESLVANGENGFTFAPTDTAAITEAMLAVATHETRRAKMGEASKRRIADWGPARFAAGLRDATVYARDHGPSQLPYGHAALCRVISEINTMRIKRGRR